MKYLKYLIYILCNRDLRRAVMTRELNPAGQRWLREVHAEENEERRHEDGIFSINTSKQRGNMNQPSDKQQSPGKSEKSPSRSVLKKTPQQNGSHTQSGHSKKGSSGIIHLLLILLLMTGGAALYFGFSGKDETVAEDDKNLIELVDVPAAAQLQETARTPSDAKQGQAPIDQKPQTLETKAQYPAVAVKDENPPSPVVEEGEDAATLLFGVVSRIRESRDE